MMSALYKHYGVFLETLSNVKKGDTLSTVWKNLSVETDKRSWKATLTRSLFGDSRVDVIQLVETKIIEIREVCLLYLTHLTLRKLYDSKKLVVSPLSTASASSIDGKESKSKIPISVPNEDEKHLAKVLGLCGFSVTDLHFWLKSLFDRMPGAINGIMALKQTYELEPDDSKAKLILAAQSLGMLYNTLSEHVSDTPGASLYDLKKFSSQVAVVSDDQAQKGLLKAADDDGQ